MVLLEAINGIFKILPKFSNFVNSEVCIGKITSKSIRLPRASCFYLKKDLKLIKKEIFSGEKIRNSGNCIYDHAHSFFGEDFIGKNNPCGKIRRMFWTFLFRILSYECLNKDTKVIFFSPKCLISLLHMRIRSHDIRNNTITFCREFF